MARNGPTVKSASQHPYFNSLGACLSRVDAGYAGGMCSDEEHR